MSGTILDTLKVSRREKANDAAALLFPADSKSSGLKRLDIAISSPASGALSGAPQEPKEPAEYEQYREASIALGAGAEAAVLVRFVAAGAASQDRAADEPARMQDARLARAENPGNSWLPASHYVPAYSPCSPCSTQPLCAIKPACFVFPRGAQPRRAERRRCAHLDERGVR
jgi:hypothetical protein